MTAPPETASDVRRMHHGLWSFLIALSTFCVMLWMVVTVLRPFAMAYEDLDPSPESVNAAAGVRAFFTPGFLIAACLQCLGIWLGFGAMFRRHDDRIVGGLGVILNVLALLFALLVLAIAHPEFRLVAVGFHST